MLFFPNSNDFSLLEYMAVSGDRRSSGFGRGLFQASLQAIDERLPGAPCILEVDVPGGKVSPGNDPTRRLRFYAAQGCRKIVGLDYILPLDSAGVPPPMMLLIHGLYERKAVSVDTVRAWLRVIYQDVYGCAPDDPRIDTMISCAMNNLDTEDVFALNPL